MGAPFCGLVTLRVALHSQLSGYDRERVFVCQVWPLLRVGFSPTGALRPKQWAVGHFERWGVTCGSTVVQDRGGAVLKFGTGPIDDVNSGRPRIEANSLAYPLLKPEKQ